MHRLTWDKIAKVVHDWSHSVAISCNTRIADRGLQCAVMAGKDNTRILGGDLRGLDGAVRIQFNLGISGINFKNELEGIGSFRLTVTINGARSCPLARSNTTLDVRTPGLLDPPVQGAGLNFQTGLLAHTSLFRNGRNGGEERCPQGQGRGRSYRWGKANQTRINHPLPPLVAPAHVVKRRKTCHNTPLYFCRGNRNNLRQANIKVEAN